MMLAKIPIFLLHVFLIDHWLIHLLLWAFFFISFSASASPGATLSTSGLFLGLPTCPFSLKHSCLRLPQLLFPFLLPLKCCLQGCESLFYFHSRSLFFFSKKKKIFFFCPWLKSTKVTQTHSSYRVVGDYK